MKNIIKISLIVFLLSTAFSVRADNSVSLEVLDECGINYAGESCSIGLETKNTTGDPVEGAFVFSISEFDGIGIDVYLNGNTSTWNNGSVEFQGFRIEEGTNLHELSLQTHSALVSGEYSFVITIFGVNQEEVIIPSVILTSMGGSSYSTTTTTTIPIIKSPMGLPEELSIKLPEELPITILHTTSSVAVVEINESIIEDIITEEGQHFQWFWLFIIILLLFLLLLLIHDRVQKQIS